MATFTDKTAQEMLILAATTYVEFADAGSQGAGKAVTMRASMQNCLDRLTPPSDGWDIVWGPVGYRLPFAMFDDAAMLVARSRSNRKRFAVAVRGTNPVALSDWVFGDLMVLRQIPWQYGTAPADAKLSFSSALGLSILQRLTWNPPAAGGSHLLASLKSSVGKVSDGFLKTVASLTAGQSATLRQLRVDIGKSLAPLSAAVHVRTPEVLRQRLDHLAQRPIAAVTQTTLKLIDQALTTLQGQNIDPLRLLLGDAALANEFRPGVRLIELLAQLVKDEGSGLEIYVTGHSKGGALAPTLALWLADSQGPDNPDGWDPNGLAKVFAYSFAGPTAGNKAFADHSNDRIGDRCFRIFNPLDVVPQAWQEQNLAALPSLYKPPVEQVGALAPVSAALIQHMQGARLDYTHIGKNVVTLDTAQADDKQLFVEQVIYQHLEAYFKPMGLDGSMNTLTFFNPLL